MAENPGSGGGKIRPKRATSSRKPYSRASFQRKSFLSRVTNSVKTLLNPITPKWLASRLAHDENPHSPREDLQRGSQEASTSSVNHQEACNRTNNNYKRSPLSRPPLTESAKTSSSSLQYYITPPDTPAEETRPVVFSSKVDKGKEGLIKHLTMTSKRAKMEAESPVGSDSSYLRNEMKYLFTNDNASVASSSGCSSSLQVGSRRTDTSDNDINQKPLWSSSMDSLASSKASSSRQQATMSSHKRPKFNPAVFGMPSLGTKKNPDFPQSSFYEGPVQFGGANASGRSPYFATPYKIPSVTKVKVRHINHQRTPGRSSASSPRSSKSSLEESSATAMSSTAKKILQTLEKMSTPLNDARKIPTMARTPSSFMAERQKRKTIAGSFTMGNTLHAPPVVGISSPSTARLRRRSHMPLHNSLLVRKTKEKQKEEENATILIRDDPGPSTVDIPDSRSISARGVPAPIASMSSSASMPKLKSAFGSEGGGGKMKSQRKTTSHYSSMQEEEEDAAPDLPNVPLPVSNLPSFNFGKSMITSTPAVRAADRMDHKTAKKPEFNFASPVIKTTNAEQSRTSTNTPKFQFSSPSTKGPSVSEEQGTPKTRPASNFNPGSKPNTPSLVFAPDPKVVSDIKASKQRSSPLAKENTQSEGGFKAAKSLKSGSVLDILGSKAEVPKSENTSSNSAPPNSNLPPLKQSKSGWTCEVCMVPNDDTADSCAACTTPKPGVQKKTPLSRLIAAQKKGWDCGTCMVPNDPDAEQCVACGEPKPGSVSGSKTSSSVFKTATSKAPVQTFSFGIPATKDRSLDDVRSKTAASFSLGIPAKKDSNEKDTVSKSENTTTGNPLPKKQPGTWECGSCWVQNDSTSAKCDACQTEKPLTAKRKPIAQSSSSSSREPKQSGWGAFGKKSTANWECEVCMVPNPDERKTCEACESPRPGTKKEKLNTSFKFGENSSGLFKFGIPDTKTAPALQTDKEKENGKQNNGEISTTKSDNVVQDSSSTSKTDATAPTKPTFSFGVPGPAPTASSGAAFGNAAKPASSAPTFNFGAKTTTPTETTPDQKKEDKTETKPAQSLFALGTQKKNEPSGETTKLPAFGSAGSVNFGFGAKPSSSAEATTASQSATQSTTASSLNFLLKAQVPSSQSTSIKIPTFGSGGTSTFQTSQTSNFGGLQKENKDDPKPEGQKQPGGSFAFGSNKPSPGLFQFAGSSNKPTETPGKRPLFGFAATSAEEKKETNVFGAASSADKTANPPTFAGFGKPTPLTAPTEPKKTEAPKPTFAGFGGFGNTQSPASQSSSGIFSSASTSNPTPFGAPSAGSSLSGANSNPFGGPSATGGVFGSSAGSTPAFGTPSSNAKPALPKPSFAFGANSNNQQSKEKTSEFTGFQFGANNNQPSSGFQFGAGTQQNATTSQPSVGFNFGATPNKPAFNAASSAPSAGFQFGNSNAGQSNGIFQFGAGSNQPKPDSTGENNPFAFGSGNTNTGPSSTGFNFGGAATPTFNFTGGQPATPQTGAGGPMFSMGQAPPNENPFNVSGRSTTPVQNTANRRIRQARRKLRK